MLCWTVDQLSAFLTWATERGCADVVAWRVLAYSGARRGEALALRWRDLDTDAGGVSVRRSVGLVRTKGQPYEIQEGPTKSGKERFVDLDPQTIAALRSWRAARASLDLRLARDEALIFGALESKHQHPERFSRRFSEALARYRRQLGGDAPPMIRLHDLRHTHASILLGDKWPVKLVSERLGHSSPVITMTVYAHVMPTMQAKAAARFAALIGGEQS